MTWWNVNITSCRDPIKGFDVCLTTDIENGLQNRRRPSRTQGHHLCNMESAFDCQDVACARGRTLKNRNLDLTSFIQWSTISAKECLCSKHRKLQRIAYGH
ncbi:uncharacterized protein ARMOST_13925 [Armillaria ostoyae]|uniref:Uncharacterized protein n=1 Tax=Armillaria ostoyae TaxID=47428 RepID=A0A284RP64_ARMOS|nr:uncharacterized protein ARMOST_13925 [Armillaria ostoyae]